MHFDWDDDGLRFAAVDTLPPRTETVSRGGRVIHRVPWDRLTHLEPVDPWPALRIGWDGAGEVVVPAPGEREAFAERVAEAVAAARRRAPGAVHPGWLAAPDVRFEAVRHYPGESPAPSDGAYRSLADAGASELVASRRALTAFEAFFDWLASTEAFPFREQPAAIAVTHDHVYVRERDGQARRIARAHLRAAIASRRAGTIYVFGRRARLLVPEGPAGEAVRGVLEAQLRGVGRSPRGPEPGPRGTLEPPEIPKD